jgi:hypothetical protein
MSEQDVTYAKGYIDRQAIGRASLGRALIDERDAIQARVELLTAALDKTERQATAQHEADMRALAISEADLDRCGDQRRQDVAQMVRLQGRVAALEEALRSQRDMWEWARDDLTRGAGLRVVEIH